MTESHWLIKHLAVYHSILNDAVSYAVVKCLQGLRCPVHTVQPEPAGGKSVCCVVLQHVCTMYNILSSLNQQVVSLSVVLYYSMYVQHTTYCPAPTSRWYVAFTASPNRFYGLLTTLLSACGCDFHLSD